MEQTSGGLLTLHRLCRPVSFLTPDLIARPPSWLGHVPFAFWIVEALRPNIVVELGTHTGNSYSAFCQAVKHVGQNTACFAVDTWEGDPHAGYYGDEVYRTFAAYHDPKYGTFSRLLRMTFDAAAGHFSDGAIDLLHIDGLHTYDAVRHDFETWRPKMGRRGVVLFHDINVRKDDFGVWRLWEELAAAHLHFAFLHSNGLGVLGLGDDLPEPLRWLFGAQAENGTCLQEIRTFFDRLGGGVVARSLADCRAEELVDLARAKDSVIVARDEEIQAVHRKVWERDLTLRDYQAMVQERDRTIHARNQEIEERERRIATLMTAMHDRNLESQRREQSIGELRTEVDDRDRSIRTLQSALIHKEQQVQALLNSTSWRVLAPVRWLGRLGNQLGRYYRSRSHRMSLKPLRHIRSADGRYESTGNDPAFLLKTNHARMPSGWCLLSFHVDEASTTLAPVLYIDRGNGFSDATALGLPPVRKGWIHQLILLRPDLKALRLDPTIGPARFRLGEVTVREIGKLQVLLLLISRYGCHWQRDLGYLRRRGWMQTKRMLVDRLLAKRPLQRYATWIAMYDTLHPEDRAAIRADAEALSYKPLVSVVMPVYDAPIEFLRQALDSVLEQLYPHWELCVADDCSPNPEILRVLTTYQHKDSRIKVVHRDQTGNISAASNSALALATGEFVALMDHDDVLPGHALYMVAVELNRHPDADIVYSDEDKIDGSNIRYGAYFKSDWNPDLMRGQNLISHLGVYRRSLLESIGGFRLGYEGSQDYDLALRTVERTTPERIRHIPHVLYHWRVFSQSGSFSSSDLPRATRAARQAVQDHLDRLGTAATVGPAPGLDSYSRVTYRLPAVPPPVTLIVPTRDRVDLLRQCVGGLIEQTDYPDLDVIIVDNGSREVETLAYFASLEGESRVKILPFDREFNYSAINNFAVEQARGSVIGLINNDIQVIEPGWLKEMVSHAVRPEVGAVGAKLLYADERVQHAGVITGIHGVANHAHKFSPRQHVGYFGRLVLTQEFSCVTAACLVMRKAVYEEVGGLDETNLPVSFNDIDLCLRIRQKGYLVVWTPHAELYHLESVSRGRDTHPDGAERAAREVRYMKECWGESLLCDPYYSPNLTLDDVNFALAFPPRGKKPWLRQ